MRRSTTTLALSLLSPFATLSFATSALADVSRCGCEAPGVELQGGLAAAMAVAGVSALLIGRAKRRR